jgi:hypothetical protein
MKDEGLVNGKQGNPLMVALLCFRLIEVDRLRNKAVNGWWW